MDTIGFDVVSLILLFRILQPTLSPMESPDREFMHSWPVCGPVQPADQSPALTNPGGDGPAVQSATGRSGFKLALNLQTSSLPAPSSFPHPPSTPPVVTQDNVPPTYRFCPCEAHPCQGYYRAPVLLLRYPLCVNPTQPDPTWIASPPVVVRLFSPPGTTGLNWIESCGRRELGFPNCFGYGLFGLGCVWLMWDFWRL